MTAPGARRPGPFRTSGIIDAVGSGQIQETEQQARGPRIGRSMEQITSINALTSHQVKRGSVQR